MKPEALDVTEFNPQFVVQVGADSNLSAEDLEEYEYPFTPRSRWLFWKQMQVLSEEIRLGVAENNIDEVVTHQFPRFVGDQHILWWNELFLSSLRLVEAARTGEHLQSRSPGEEALVYSVCLRKGDLILDIMDGAAEDWKREYEALPEREADENFDWIHVAEVMAGDLDIEMVWDASPPNRRRKDYGDWLSSLGDYAPERWHEPWSGSEVDILLEQHARVEDRLKVVIPELHDEYGNSWATIGRLLGISKQAAWERYGKAKGSSRE